MKRPYKVDLRGIVEDLDNFDEYWYRVMKPEASVKVAQFRAQLGGDVRNSFNRLVHAGCDPDWLAWLLLLVQDRVEDSLLLFGFSTGKLESKLRQLKNCAETIRSFNAHDFGVALNGSAKLFQRFRRLSHTLSEYAELAAHTQQNLGSKQHFYLDVSKAQLLSFVKCSTGQEFDYELATLISDVTKRNYSRASHQNWKRKYESRLISFANDKLKNRCVKPKRRIQKRILEQSFAKLYRNDCFDDLAQIGQVPWGWIPKNVVNSSGGKFQVGDYLLAIDGQSILQFTPVEPAKLLQERLWASSKGMGKTMCFSVRRNEQLLEIII